MCRLCIGLVSEALSKDIKTHLQQMAKNNCGKLLLEMKTFSEEFAERCKTNNQNGECVCCKLWWGMIGRVLGMLQGGIGKRNERMWKGKRHKDETSQY